MTLVIMAVLLITIIVGLVLGMMRGFRRAVTRLILVVLSFALTVAFRNIATEKLMYTNFIMGKSPYEYLVGLIPEDYSAYIDVIKPVIFALCGLIVFIFMFIILRLITLVLYWILCIFVRPKRDSLGKKHKMPLLGLIVGGVQGLLVAMVVAPIITGLSNNVEKVASMKLNDEQIIDLDNTPFVSSLKISDYNNSNLANTMRKFGFAYSIAQRVTIQGETYTIDEQMNTVKDAMAVANVISKINEVNLGSGLTLENVSNMKDLIRELGVIQDSIKDGSEEEIAAVNTLLRTLGGTVSDSLGNISIDQVNLTEASKAMDLMEEVQNGDNTKVSEMMDSVIESGFGDVITDATGLTLMYVDDNSKSLIEADIDSRADLSEAEKITYKKMFGIIIE